MRVEDAKKETASLHDRQRLRGRASIDSLKRRSFGSHALLLLGKHFLGCHQRGVKDGGVPFDLQHGSRARQRKIGFASLP